MVACLPSASCASSCRLRLRLSAAAAAAPRPAPSLAPPAQVGIDGFGEQEVMNAMSLHHPHIVPLKEVRAARVPPATLPRSPAAGKAGPKPRRR